MLTAPSLFSFRSLRPLLLMALFAVVWSARGDLDDVAQHAAGEAARLAAECAAR